MAADAPLSTGRAIGISLAVVCGGVLLSLQACFGTAPSPTPPALPRALESPEALVPFFNQLAALDDKAGRQPVRILQIGDSHTANDSLSGRLRDRFQGRFGAAGRGWLPAGVPFKYYRPNLVRVSESGWQHVTPKDHAGIALGLDAVAAESGPSADMTLESTDPGGFDRFGVEYLTQPNGSAFTIAIGDDAPVRVSTAAAMTTIRRFGLPLDRPAQHVELRAEGRPPVTLLGWTVERDVPGIIYENHGTIGATVDLLDQMSPAAIAFELAKRRPALLIVAFGTNEGFADGLDIDRYKARFADNVAALRRDSPDAAVLVLGPPDGNRVEHGCAAVRCGASDDCAWHEPAKLAAVRDAQRRIAAERGWAYWDWFDAMGGQCSIDRMAGDNPPLAMPDHVHLSTPGYQGIADLLFSDLMRAYDRWKMLPRTS